MRHLPFSRTVIALAVSAMAAGMHCHCAWADPAGAQVRSGAANVTGIGTGAVTVTTTTPSALIQWQSFQVGPGQSVNFVLPSATSTVFNQIPGSASLQGAVTPSAQVMFLQNSYVSGGSFALPFDLGNSSLAALQLDRSHSSLARAGERREGLAREIVARLADGRVVALASAREDVSATPSGEVLIAAGRSIELADINNPGLRVLIRAPAGQALNVSQLLTRARSTGVFGVMLAQPNRTRRSDTEPVHQFAGVRESRDAVDTLIAYLDDAASRIARLADPAPDLMPAAVASLAAPQAAPAVAPVQVASLAPSVVVVAEPAKHAPAVAVQDIELMESRVASWQLAVALVPMAAPVDTELMEAQVHSWHLAVAPVDTELMEMQVGSWQLAVALVPAAAPVDTELMESQVSSWHLAVAPVDIELMEMQVSSWQLAVALAPVTPVAIAAAQDIELMESRVASWQLAQAPAPVLLDLELMETQVTSWQLAIAPTSAPAPAPASALVQVAAAAPSADKPMQLASAAPAETQRIVLPERRTTPPKLIRIEFKGGSFFM